MENELKRITDNIYDIDFYKSLKGKEGFTARVDKGRLPIIDIKEQPFFVDVRLGLLRPMGNFHTEGIDITDLPMDSKTKQLFFYYHIPTMTRVSFPEDIREFPKDVVGVWVPNKYFLDPVAMARINDKELDYYTGDGITLRMYRKAKIVPISKTPLAELVQKNKENVTDPGLCSTKSPAKKKQTKTRRGI